MIIPDLGEDPSPMRSPRVYSIAPREAAYKGKHFRSTLEARWAVLFDTIGWSWDYEPDLEVDGLKYIPDFQCVSPVEPNLEWWIEIKPTFPTEAEIMKAKTLARKIGVVVTIAFGEVGGPQCLQVIPAGTVERSSGMRFCQTCLDFVFAHCFCDSPRLIADSPAFLAAIQKAKSATFDAPVNLDSGCGLEWLFDCDMNDWESEFVDSIISMRKRRLPLSEKQIDVLDRIMKKYE